MDYKTIQKTTRSYMQTLKRITEKFPKLDRCDSGYTYYIGESFEAYSNKYEYAEDIYIETKYLFNYGRPTIIEKNHWVYKSSYFKIKFIHRDKYINYCNYFDKKGDEHSICIFFGENTFGLNEWNKNKKKIKEIANKCISEVKEKILKKLKEADKHYKEWKEAIQSIKII
jgi:hypothetical protein